VSTPALAVRFAELWARLDGLEERLMQATGAEAGKPGTGMVRQITVRPGCGGRDVSAAPGPPREQLLSAPAAVHVDGADVLAAVPGRPSACAEASLEGEAWRIGPGARLTPAPATRAPRRRARLRGKEGRP
jgi:hypothetical protein